MAMYEIYVLVVFVATVSASSPNVTKRYRSDYVYNRNTDAFYKLHPEARQGWQAMKICEIEGSSLLELSTQEDVAQLMEMLGRFPTLGEYVWIAQNEMQDIYGEYDLTPQAGVTPAAWQGRSCQARNIWLKTIEKPCTERHPFICKVEASAAPYDARCGSYGKSYQYVPSVGSCYKIPRIAYTWNMAYADCRAEGGHLLVLNSETERLAVKDVIYRESWILGSGNRDYLLAGFREVPTNNYSRVFITIYDEALDIAGFNEWQNGEPNLRNEQCGCVFGRDSTLADVGCEALSGYVCEKEIPSDIDDNQEVTVAAPHKPCTPTLKAVPAPHESYTPTRLKTYTYTETVISTGFE